MTPWGRTLASGVFALACTASAPAQAKSVAVVVGNNEPPAGASGAGLTTLRYADDDARRYADLFGRFADQTVLLTVHDAQTRARLTDPRVDGPPTLAALRRTLAKLDDEDEADLTVYVVFTGHGALDEAGAPFLSMLDGPLTRDVLFDDLLGPLAAHRVHLVIDACHAAGVVGIRGKRFGKEIDGNTVPTSVDEEQRWAKEHTLARFPHVGVLASSSAGESSHEWSVLEAGVFSHEVISGLWGAADINADRRIEYSELQSFVASANRAVDDPRAKPSVVVSPPALDPHAALIDLQSLRETAMLEGDLSKLGHFHVELADGRRHLDANVGGPVTLGLPAGTSYLRTGSLEYAMVLRPGERVEFDTLTGKPAESTARGSVAASFRQRLFAEPYTYDYYRGYVDNVGATPVAAPNAREQPVAPAKKPVIPPPRELTPPVDDPPLRKRPRHDRRAGIAFVSLGAVSGLAALGTGIAAGVFRSRFSSADNERDAARYTTPHQRLATAAVATAITSGAATVLGVLLLRRAKRAK